MIRFEEMAYTAAIHTGRMGERWQASAARMRIPSAPYRTFTLRSAWCRPDRCGVRPWTMSLAPGGAAAGELAAGARSGHRAQPCSHRRR
jgi:hypothetical protein